MHVNDLLMILHKSNLGRASTHLADSTYGIPTLGYLTEDFPTWWGPKLKERGLGEWDTRWDCDDFAWTFFTDIRWMHFNTKKSQAEGLAVGVMYYNAGAREEDGTGGGHAINIAAVSPTELVFLEPQRAARGQDPVIDLTAHEIASTWFVNF